MINNKNDFYTIHRFMIDDLKLVGSRLNVYAIIYGFTRDGVQEFRGSRTYISNFTGSTIRNVQRILNSLTEDGLIIKNEYNDKVSYKINIDKLNFFENNDKMSPVQDVTSDKMSPPSDKMSPPSDKMSPPSDKMSPNNIEDNINNNILNKIKINNNACARKTYDVGTIIKIEKVDDTILFDGTAEDAVNYMLKDENAIKDDINYNHYSWVTAWAEESNCVSLYINTKAMPNGNKLKEVIAYFNSILRRYNLQTNSNYSLLRMERSIA